MQEKHDLKSAEEKTQQWWELESCLFDSCLVEGLGRVDVGS